MTNNFFKIHFNTNIVGHNSQFHLIDCITDCHFLLHSASYAFATKYYPFSTWKQRFPSLCGNVFVRVAIILFDVFRQLFDSFFPCLKLYLYPLSSKACILYDISKRSRMLFTCANRYTAEIPFAKESICSVNKNSSLLWFNGIIVFHFDFNKMLALVRLHNGGSFTHAATFVILITKGTSG